VGNLPRVEVSRKHPILIGIGTRKEDTLDTYAISRVVTLRIRVSVSTLIAVPCGLAVFGRVRYELTMEG
jgi:hypothetical protein